MKSSTLMISNRLAALFTLQVEVTQQSQNFIFNTKVVGLVQVPISINCNFDRKTMNRSLIVWSLILDLQFQRPDVAANCRMEIKSFCVYNFGRQVTPTNFPTLAVSMVKLRDWNFLFGLFALPIHVQLDS